MLPVKVTSRESKRDSSSISGKTRREMEERLCRIAEQGYVAVAARLAELEGEWTAGRAAKVTAAVSILVGVLLSLLSPWWLLVPTALGLLLLEHAVAREGVLSLAFKGLGLRSAVEIEHERWALKAIRGDFSHLPSMSDEQVEEEAIARLEGEGGIVDEPMDHDRGKRAAVREVINVIEE